MGDLPAGKHLACALLRLQEVMGLEGRREQDRDQGAEDRDLGARLRGPLATRNP